jgi:hypothetical protein
LKILVILNQNPRHLALPYGLPRQRQNLSRAKVCAGTKFSFLTRFNFVPASNKSIFMIFFIEIIFELFKFAYHFYNKNICKNNSDNKLF